MSSKNTLPTPPFGYGAAHVLLAFFVLLLALGGRTLTALAVPDDEKIALQGKSSESGAIAIAVYKTFNYLLLANRETNTVSFFDLQTQRPLTKVDGSPLVLAVTGGPVAIATYDDTGMLNPTPTVALAFVAGYSSNRLTIINLIPAVDPMDAAADSNETLPEVVTLQFNIADAAVSDSSQPGPIALLVEGTNLYVANGGDGTIQWYTISGTAPYLTHMSFPVGGTNQTTAKGNLVVCSTGNTLPGAGGAKPRALLRYSSRNFVGCDSGTVSHFGTTGDVNIRGDIYGGNLGPVRGLAGDPRTGLNILYVLDDENDGVFAVDVDPMSNIFESMTDPAITPICNDGGTDADAVPLPTGATSTALTAFTDSSSMFGGSFVAALNTAAGDSDVQLVDLASVDRDSMTSPECALGGAGSLSTSVTLELGDAYFDTNTPAGIGEQIFHHLGYIGVPNFGVGDGNGAATLVTDNPNLTDGTASRRAITPIAPGPNGTEHGSVDVSWSSDVAIVDLPAPTVVARIKNRPLTQASVAHTATLGGNPTGKTLKVTVTTANLVASGVVTNTSNEIIEIAVVGQDGNGNGGLAGEQVIFDSLPPTAPVSASVDPGDRQLTIFFSGVSDPDPSPVPSINLIHSGIAGYFIKFISATDAIGAPVTLTTTLQMGLLIPSIGAGVILVGLDNDVTYVFDVYSVDWAGNISAAPLSVTGTPIPGVGIVALTGEKGCTFNPGGTFGWGDLAFLLFALTAAFAVGRREKRAAERPRP